MTNLTTENAEIAEFKTRNKNEKQSAINHSFGFLVYNFLSAFSALSAVNIS